MRCAGRTATNRKTLQSVDRCPFTKDCTPGIRAEYLNNFVNENATIKPNLFVHDNWAIWRNTQSFESKDLITHGGAHFLEVVIPFIKIEK